MEKRSHGNAKYFCTYCKIYIYNNKTSIDKHNSSPSHLSSIRRHVTKIRKDEKDKNILLKEFEKRSGIFLDSSINDALPLPSSFYDSSSSPSSIANRKASSLKVTKRNNLLGARDDLSNDDSSNVLGEHVTIENVLGEHVTIENVLGEHVSNNTEISLPISLPKLRKFKKP